MEEGIIIAGFEPQEDIVGYVRRLRRQREKGLEIVCPFRHNGICNDSISDLSRSDIICENDYTLCQTYIQINAGYE